MARGTRANCSTWNSLWTLAVVQSLLWEECSTWNNDPKRRCLVSNFDC